MHVCPLMQLPLSPRVENRGGRLLLTYTEQGSIQLTILFVLSRVKTVEADHRSFYIAALFIWRQEFVGVSVY